MICRKHRNLSATDRPNCLLAGVFSLILSISVPFSIQALDKDAANAENISISVQSTEIAEVFEMLSRERQVNILLGSDVDGEISVNLYNVGLDEAVRTISAAAGFAVEHVDNSYFIMTQEEAGKDMAGGLTTLKTFKAQYTDVQAIEQILTKHLSRYGKITTLPERKLIVVEEIPAFMHRIEMLLAEVDRRPKQILIEAKILEISLDESETFGIDWNGLFTTKTDSIDEGIGLFGTQGLATPTAPGFFFSFVNPNVSAALNALNAKGRVRTLSTPRLLALEHEEAEVVIGDRTGYRVTTTINQVTTESVAFLESGVILKVTPSVDQHGQIMMDVHPEVSTPTISEGIPSLTTTEVTTQFLADNGQTIFIAGLMRNSLGQQKNGVPVLGDIPVLGRLFSNTEKLVINTETVVLITPRVVEAGVAKFMSSESDRVDEIGEQLKNEVNRVKAKLEPELSLRMDDMFRSNNDIPTAEPVPAPIPVAQAVEKVAVLQMAPAVIVEEPELTDSEDLLPVKTLSEPETRACTVKTTDFMSLAGHC